MSGLFDMVSAGARYLTTFANSQPSPQASRTSTSPLDQTRQHGSEPLSYADICVVRAMLKSLRLPTELVLDILDYAQYEPVIEFVSRRPVHAATGIGSMRVSLPAEVLSHKTVKLISSPNVTLKVKEINFEIKSHDQGWTSENTRGTFNTSSWLEIAILRPQTQSSFSDFEKFTFWDLVCDDPQDLQDQLLSRGYGCKLVDERPEDGSVGAQGGEPPLAWYLQGNKVTERENIDYEVTWAADGSRGNEGAGNGEGFLNALREGDGVLVMARAKYQGWLCAVTSVKMTVRYGFNETS